MYKDYESMASALFDGGWRSEDAESIAHEYQLSNDDVEEIVKLLKGYEESRQNTNP